MARKRWSWLGFVFLAACFIASLFITPLLPPMLVGLAVAALLAWCA